MNQKVPRLNRGSASARRTPRLALLKHNRAMFLDFVVRGESTPVPQFVKQNWWRGVLLPVPDLVVLGEQARELAAADELKILDQAVERNPSCLDILSDDMDGYPPLLHLE